MPNEPQCSEPFSSLRQMSHQPTRTPSSRATNCGLPLVMLAAMKSRLRSSGNGKHTTVLEHMPSSHRRYADWTIDRIRRDAAAIGPASAALCELILEQRSHPEQGFRACLGIVRLVKAFGTQRVEAAAARARDIGARTYGSVKSILDNNLDRHTAQQRAADGMAIVHPNIRGARYYH